MNSFDPHELNWLAFRYVAGEMSADECAEFETRLADDQAAREAVASAVELTQTMACAANDSCDIAAPEIVVRKRGRAVRGRRLLWVGLGAAACLTLVVLLRGVFDVRDIADSNSNPTRRARDSQPQQLALVWSQTRQVEESDVAADQDADEEATPVDDAASADDRAMLPSWIVAAVTESEKSPRPDRDPADDLEEF